MEELKPVKRVRHYWYSYYTMKQRRRYGRHRDGTSELFNLEPDTCNHNVKIGSAGGLLFNRWAYPQDGMVVGEGTPKGINGSVPMVNWYNDIRLNRKRHLFNARQ